MDEFTDVVHSPGPLDGSLYAKVNKNKRGEQDDRQGHTDKEDCLAFTWPATATQRPTQLDTTPIQLPSTPDQKKLQLPSNHTPSPNVIVLNGNKIVYVPQTAPPSLSLEREPSTPTSLSDNPYLFISSATSRNISSSMSDVASSFVSPSQVTRIELSDDHTNPQVVVKTVAVSPKNKEPKVNPGNMADGGIQVTSSQSDAVVIVTSENVKAATTQNVSDVTNSEGIAVTASHIVSGVIKNGQEFTVKNRFDNVIKQSVDFSRLSAASSCSATTLSSTETDDGEVHPELSDRDTSSESSSDEEQNQTVKNITAKFQQSIPPKATCNPIPGNIQQVESLKPSDTTEKVKETSQQRPPSPASDSNQETAAASGKGSGWDLPSAPPVPVPDISTRSKGDMNNGGIYSGNYEKKGPDYAVPMRDMKITTIPSKRAVLVSASAESDDGIGHETMTSVQQSSENDRDSFYDEGNMSYTGGGYATIDEYEADSGAKAVTRNESDMSNLPEDVQALLNGLQDGPVSSDIDSGFHGSSAALPQSKGDHAKVTSQSSSEFSDPFPSPSNGAPPNTNNNATPSYEGKSYFTERVIPHNGSAVQHAQFLDSPVGAHVSMVGREVSYPDHSKQQTTAKKKQGVTMSTQTLPEPKEAKIEIITMRNVYDKDMVRPTHTQPSIVTRNDRPQPSPSPVEPTIAITSPVLAEFSGEVPQSEGGFITAPPMDQYYEDVEDEMERENMMNVEEQIRHTQQHLQFLQEQQEKLTRRKIDRTRFRETMKRNSSAFETQSQGYQFSLPISATLPRQPHRRSPTEEVNRIFNEAAVSTRKNEMMSPVATSNQNRMGGPTALQQNQQPDVWQQHGRKLGRQASDTSYDRQRPIGLTKSKAVDVEPEPPRQQDNNNDIMSNDLQEQLAELDRCIAQLTTSLDVPDPQDSSPVPQVTNRRRSFTLEIERKMTPNIPDGKENALVVPRPPTRSRSSFESYKRLSQEFDGNMKRASINDQDASVNDDVFTPPPQIPRKKRNQPFPPQTSHTRRQHFAPAPAPPPKRRLSLEERLSPELIQALALNPGAKPKEDIHSYKEDLERSNAPATPSFPNSPGTPYVNSESPERAKSPPGLMKTPLSMLHLKPTQSPTETLHHHDDDLRSSPANGGAMQNGHVKETALLSDGGRRHDGLEARNSAQREAQLQHRINNGQNHRVEYSGPTTPNDLAVHTKILSVQRDIQPVHSTPQQQQQPTSHLHSHLPSEPATPPLPPQYQHNHSGASHSSHSPAATSSNSRRESSDSLDGPSTRHSNSSLLSSSSSASSPHSGLPVSSPNSAVSPVSVMRPGSQISSYDRNYHMQGTRSGDESLGSPQSGRTSSSSISDIDRMNSEMSQTTVSKAPKFIRDTTSFWYKPDITRDQALALLRDKAAGCFVVRDSRCFPGAFGLALKVDKLPPTVQARPGADVANEYVRHFLIEPSSRGVKLKGCPNEPVFGSLSALVYQHSITPLALPCKLLIPTTDLEVTPVPGTLPRTSQSDVATNSAAELLKQGAACNVIYIGSADTESLTGPQAIERAIRESYKTAQTNSNKTSIVHFKVSPQGITLTDNARKLFFRRHYPTTSVTYCGLDPQGNGTKVQKARRWDATGVHGSPDAWLFGFVARKQAGSSDNTCHVFAELDPAQPARAIVNFVSKVLIGTSRQNYP